MRMSVLIVALVAGATVSTVLHAASPPDTDIAHYADRQLVTNYAKDGPGAAMIVARGDHVIFRSARGVGDVDAATPLSAQSVFEIGSITKQFAAAGLLKLVDAGKVSLDDPLSKYVPDYPNGNAITIQELLNHTSGVKSYTDKVTQASSTLATRELIKTFEDDTPDFAPGSSWAYDNSGYVLVGAVIEAVSGKPWYAYLRETLFVPLGLTHTGYTADASVARVRGYALADGKAVPAEGVHSVHADGALVSTVDDLLAWNRALHKGRVLKRDSYRRMTTPVGAAIPEEYGFALWCTTLRNRPMLGHSGHITGFSTYLLYLPQSDLSIAILQNMDRDPSFADPSVTARKIAAFAIGDPFPTPSPIAMVDAATLEGMQGVYGTDPLGPREGSVQGARLLRVIDGTLTMSRTGDSRSNLIPTGVDAFQSSDSLDRLQIEREAGTITGLRLFPNGEGKGLLLARTSQRVQAVPSSVTLSHSALERIVGTYATEGMELRIILDGERLKGRVAGQRAFELRAESANRFFVTEIDATLDFSPTDGAPAHLTVHQGAETVELTRAP